MKKILLLILVLVVGVFAAGCNQDTETEKVIGNVNSDNITSEEWVQHYNLIKINYEMQTGAELDEEKDKDVVKGLKDQAFEDLVLQKLLWQEAEKKGIEIDNEQVDADLKQFKELSNQDSPDGYEKFLEEAGLDEKYIIQELKTEKLYWKLQEEVTGSVKVSEEDSQKYYEENKDLFKQPGGIEIFHILVNTEKEANDILLKLQQGDDFSELARQYSTCPSKAQGGNLGIINEDNNYVPEFKEAALKLQPGEMTSKPVKTEFGYHIIKAGDKKEARTLTFDEVKDGISAQLEQQKKSEVYNNYLQELRTKAEIEDKRQ